MHRYSIDAIIGWFRDGVLWFILAVAGLNRLVTVPQSAPDWWYRWFSWGDWYYGSDNDWHPYRELAEKFILGAWRLLGDFVDESATHFAADALTLARAIIGSLPGWAATVALGLAALLSRIGEGALLWASNAIQAAQKLYDWLPNEIKFAGMSWVTLFDLVKSSVKSWVITAYSNTVSIAANSWSWITQSGATLGNWYVSVGAWLSDLRANFEARVTGTLGSAWSRLLAFDRDALAWVYNFKSLYAKDVSDFFASPGAFILRVLQEELERLW